MMKQRKTSFFASSKYDLPHSNQNNSQDGSGRSVKMDAPLVRRIKNSSVYTKSSYAWLVVTIFVLWTGCRALRHNYSAVYLNCNGTECTLQITPPLRSAKLSVQLDRTQILSVKPVMVTLDGAIVWDTLGKDVVTPRVYNSKHHKKHPYSPSKNERKPDENGHYASYVVILNENGNATTTKRDFMAYGSAAMTDPDIADKLEAKEKDQYKEEEQQDQATTTATTNKKLPSFEALQPYLQYKPSSSDEAVFHPRLYNIGQTKRSARVQISKVVSYIMNRRHKLTLSETRDIHVWGMVCLILGMFSLVLCLLIGQFLEPKKSRLDGIRTRPGLANNNTTPAVHGYNRVNSHPSQKKR